MLPDLKVEMDAGKGSTREETARQCGKDAPNPHFDQAASMKHKGNVLTGGRNPPLSLGSGRKKRKRAHRSGFKKETKKSK